MKGFFLFYKKGESYIHTKENEVVITMNPLLDFYFYNQNGDTKTKKH